MASPSNWLRNADGSDVTATQLAAEANAIIGSLIQSSINESLEVRTVLHGARSLQDDLQASPNVDLRSSQRRLVHLHNHTNSILAKEGFKLQNFISMLPARGTSLLKPSLRHAKVDLQYAPSGARQSRITTAYPRLPHAFGTKSSVPFKNGMYIEVRHDDGTTGTHSCIPFLTGPGYRYKLANMVPPKERAFVRTAIAPVEMNATAQPTASNGASNALTTTAQPQIPASTGPVASSSGPPQAPRAQAQPTPSALSFRPALPAPRSTVSMPPNNVTMDPATWRRHAVAALLRNSDWPTIQALMCTSKAMYTLCKEIVKYVLLPKGHLAGSTMMKVIGFGTPPGSQKQQPQVVERVTTVQPHGPCCRCATEGCTHCRDRELVRRSGCKSNCESLKPKCNPCLVYEQKAQMSANACVQCRTRGFVECPTERGVFPHIFPEGQGLVVIVLDRAVLDKKAVVEVDPGVLLQLWWTLYSRFSHAQSIEIRNSVLVSKAILTKTHLKGFSDLKVLRIRQDPLMNYDKLGVVSNNDSRAVCGLTTGSDITFKVDFDYVGYEQHPNFKSAVGNESSAFGTLQKVMGTAIANGWVPEYIDDKSKLDPLDRDISHPENHHPLHVFTMETTGMNSKDTEHHLRRLMAADWKSPKSWKRTSTVTQDPFESLIRASPVIRKQYKAPIAEKDCNHGAIKLVECELCDESFYGIGMIKKTCRGCKEEGLSDDLFGNKRKLLGQPSWLVDDRIADMLLPSARMSFKSFLGRLAESQLMDGAKEAREEVLENLPYLL